MWELIKEDVKKAKDGILVLGIYFVCSRFLFSISCPMVVLTGYPCPGCGMTRAVIALLKGDFYGAYQMHAFVYVLIAYAILFVIWRYGLKKNLLWIKRIGVLILAAMVVYYAYRMINLFPAEPPMSYYRKNLIRFLWTRW